MRALKDPQGRTVKSVGPGAPAEVLGLKGVPMAGDELTVLKRHGPQPLLHSMRAAAIVSCCC